MSERIATQASQCDIADPSLPPCLVHELGELSDSAVVSSVCKRCSKSLEQMEQDFDELHSRLKFGSNELSRDQACYQLVERLVVEDIVSGSTDRGSIPDSIGDYSLQDLLGEGGMGRVYRATHQRLKKDVAVKVLSERALANPRSVARFEREMEAVGTVEHPNVVNALDAGTRDGTTFLVMELVTGPDCAQVCDAVPDMTVASACEIARQAAVGLQHAHSRGLIHRDIKPSNLMLTNNAIGQPIVKVMDLGLAVVGSSGAEHPLTDDGQLMGTLGFMAPEQATNRTHVGAQVDIYSLGSTLFRLLTGSIPFAGEQYRTPVQRLHGLLNDPTPSLGSMRQGLPHELVELVDQMLDRDPDQRPQSMEEVATRLSEFCDGHQLSLVIRTTLLSQRGSRNHTTVDFLATIDTARAAAAVTVVNDAAGPQKPRRSFVFCWIAIACAALLACGGLTWLRMTDGTYLRIEADPTIDVEISLLAEGKQPKTFRVGKGENQFWCESGKYRVEFPGEAGDGLQLDGRDVTITRGSKSVVTIRRVAAADKPAVEQPWDKQPLYPTAPRPYDIGFDPQLEDGHDGEGSGSNGWVGSDTDDVTGPSQLFTMLIGRGDLNAELFAGWKSATGEESSLEFIRSVQTFKPLTEADPFSFTFNIEKYFQSEGWGQLTIGLANENNNLFGIGLMGHSNHILKYGVSDWTVFPRKNKEEGITHGYAVQSDRLSAAGKESVELTYGSGKVRVRVFSDPNGQGSTRYDSGLVPLVGAKGSSLQTFSADRLFIANDQAAGDRKRRVWLRVDDIKVRSGDEDRIVVNFDKVDRGTPRVGVEPDQVMFVRTLSRTGKGSLRQAIDDATPEAVIRFDAALSGKMLRTQGESFVIDKPITIDGSTLALPLIINADARHHPRKTGPVFDVTESGSLKVRGVVVQQSTKSAIRNRAGVVNLQDCVLRQNKGQSKGGVILNWGGHVRVERCLFRNNTIGSYGGAIATYEETGRVTAVNSTFVGNATTRFHGGAIYAESGAQVECIHCTIVGNRAAGGGGGIYVADTSTLKLAASILAENKCVEIAHGVTDDDNSRRNLDGPGAIVAEGVSLLDTPGPANYTGTRPVVARPRLAALESYGNTVACMPPLLGSPAINATPVLPITPATDARGVVRPGGTNESVTIGAIEYVTKRDATRLLVPPKYGPVNTPGWKWTSPINCRKGINTEWKDREPSLAPDGLTLFFGSACVPRQAGEGDRDLWFTTRADLTKPWSKVRNVSPTVNTSAIEGHPTYHAATRTLIFMSGRMSGVGDFDLWQSTQGDDGEWSKPINMGANVNSGVYDDHPEISDDGLTLILTSTRPTGFGDWNLWICERSSVDEPFGRAVRMPRSINSSADEGDATLSADGRILIFTSNRQGGYGGNDLWACTRKDRNGAWSKPFNLGPAINSEANEQTATLSNQARSLFFSSDRIGGVGNIDLWFSNRP